MATLFPVGDRELWVASSNDGSWSLPVWIDWKWDKEADKHYALVIPAVGLYVSQQTALQAMFGFHDLSGRNGQWLITRVMAEALLHKAPGITPLAYYKWPDPNHPALPLSNPMSLSPKGPEPRTTQGSSDYEAFVAHICTVNGFPNSVVRVVMRAIADEAPKWMVENSRPLDLGFCRIVAFPFRPNWKEIVAFKFKKWRLLSKLRISGEGRELALEDAGVPEALCSPHNIALKKNGGVSYTLEVIPGKKFDSAVNAIESARVSCGTGSHVASYEKTVTKLYRHMLDALTIYLRKTALPFALVSERGASGVLRFLPTFGYKVRGVGLRRLPVHIVAPDNNFSVLGESSDKNLVREKAPKVPWVQLVQQKEADLRHGQIHGQVAEPALGEAGADGVPVLDAGESEAARESVLSIPEGQQLGVDR